MEQIAPVKDLRGHKNGVLALAFSPCGKFLATAGKDNTIRLWDVPDGIEIQSIEGHAGDIKAVAFAPEGDVFATASWDRTVKIWRTSDCSNLATIKDHKSHVNCLAFSADGKKLYSGSDDGTAMAFSMPSCEPEGTFDPKIGDIKAIAASPSDMIALGGAELHLLDAAGGLLKDNDAYTYGVRALAFSPDGKRLAVATGMEKRLEVWDVEKLVEPGSVKDSDWVNCVVFTPDGRHVVTGGMTVKVWDPVTGACVKTLEGHTDEIYAVDVSPDGKYIASASNDSTVKLWPL